jgi:hypothetical protein
LNEAISKDSREKLQKHERTGRPLGNKQFLDKLENITGRTLKSGKPWPKKKRTMKPLASPNFFELSLNPELLKINSFN